jgi:hypothetical protein
MWFDSDTKNKNCIATIYDTNITLNKPASKLIENAYRVMLGLDYDKKILYIKALNTDMALRGNIPLSSQYNISIKSSYARISNALFVREIKGILGVDSLKVNQKKFIVEYQVGSDILTIDLNKEV